MDLVHLFDRHGKTTLLDSIRSARDLATIASRQVAEYTDGRGPRGSVRSACQHARRHLLDAEAVALVLAHRSGGDTADGYGFARKRLGEALSALDEALAQVERKRFRRTERAAKACAACCRIGYALLAAEESVDAIEEQAADVMRMAC